MKLCPSKNKPSADMVMTPRPLAKAIIDHFNPTGRLCDPCAGDGAFSEQFPKQKFAPTWFEITEGFDFLSHPGQPKSYNWIITNPPWSKFVDFLVQSMRVSSNVVFLVTLNHFQTRARMRMIEEAGFRFREILLIETPPKPWPQSGFQVAAVHIKHGWEGDCKFSKL